MNQLTDTGARAAFGYSLDKDPLVGFKEASHNAQTRLALEYASILLSDLVSKVDSLEAELAALKKAVAKPAAPVKAPAKKVTGVKKS